MSPILWSVHIYAVKQLITSIGEDLFGEIGELKKFAKISHHQIKTSQSLDIPVLEIAKLILCQIVIYIYIFEKPPNIIAAKYSRFTVVSVSLMCH